MELGRYLPGTPLPILPGVTPGPKDRLRRRPPWNLWESDDSPSGSTSPPPPLAWYNTRPPGFHLPHIFVREPYLYHPVYRVCVCLTKNNITSSVVVLSFQRTVHTTWYGVYLFREQLVFLVP